MAGYCEYGDEPSGSIKCGEFYLSSLGRFSFSERTLLHGVNLLLERTYVLRQPVLDTEKTIRS